MRLLNNKTTIDFMAKSRIMAVVSGSLLLVVLGGLLLRGVHGGLDFTGGLLVEASFSKPLSAELVRQQLRNQGLDEASVQTMGDPKTFALRLPQQLAEGVGSEQARSKVVAALKHSDAQVQINRIEYVGPKVGQELARKGIMGFILALLGIAIYVWVRFEWHLALGAVAATLHDVALTMAVFVFTPIPFDLTSLAALLTVVGYSVNDTIVIFDRLRENIRRQRKLSLLEVANMSVNQTLSRTILTALATLLSVLGILFFGGESLRGFALALAVGIVVGTYSSIFVAMATAITTGLNREVFNQKPKRQDDGARV
jgi:preprotein translocase subunit SecF